MDEFYRTGMGKKFFEQDIPTLVKTIEEHTKQLERLNDNLEYLCKLWGTKWEE